MREKGEGGNVWSKGLERRGATQEKEMYIMSCTLKGRAMEMEGNGGI